MTEEEIRADEREQCVRRLRAWADETLMAITTGTVLASDTPLILRMASLRLAADAEHFMPERA